MVKREATPWSEREVRNLRAWRHEGQTNAEIADRLNRSVDSVHSKVRQLELPPLRGRRAVRAAQPTLPPLGSLKR